MKRLIPLAAVLVAGFASTASAQPLMNYTYLDAAYQWAHLDQDGVDDGNGLDAKVSYTPAEQFALEGGYNLLSTQVLGTNVDQDLFTYGGAGWYSFCDGIDLVARVGGIHARVDVDGADSVSDNGVYAGGSVRYLVTDELEADLNILWDRVDTGTWTYGGTGLYAVHENVALKGEVSIDDDSDIALLAGVRLAM